MFSSLFGSHTRIGNLRWSLDDSSQAHKAIAGRVAGALSSSGNTDFAEALASQAGAKPTVDIEKEMVDLASTQLRYESSAKLLSAAYQGLRTAIRDRA